MAIQYLVGTEEASASPVASQVYQATHDSSGKRLPYMYRSFISFSYGGKWIEDFGFISVTENNAISRDLYASFTNNTTESSIFDGQIYWSTHWDTNTLSLRLATDGVTPYELDEFKRWFKPGAIRELILAEHPHRAILARVSDPPIYNFVPFQYKTNVVINGASHATSTTRYRGFVTLNFVMDDPFWYSTSQTLFADLGEVYDSIAWRNANDEFELILESKDALKIIQEDGLPLMGQIYNQNNSSISPDAYMILGQDNAMAFSQYKIHDKYGSYLASSETTRDGAEIDYGHIAYGILAGASIEPVKITLKPGDNNAAFFYYAGTAPESPILHFTLTPSFNSAGYISSPRNKYTSENLPYDTLTIESATQQVLHYSTPGLWTAYNQAVDILTTVKQQPSLYTWEDVRKLMREQVRHYIIRNYVVSVINNISGSPSLSTVSGALAAIKGVLDSCNATFTIDCKTGQVLGEFSYKQYGVAVKQTLSENASDMIKSSYLKIVDRNYPNDNGYIELWTAARPQSSHRIWHNSANNLTNFYMTYKNRYL